MNDMNKLKFRLNKLLNIYGVSGDEYRVRKYIKKEIKDVVDSCEIDSYGNLLAVKKFGTGEGAVVLLNSHMDTVKKTEKDKIVVENDGLFVAYHAGKRSILGADDRAGIAIILSILDNMPKEFNGTLKLAFLREEEIGCVGSSNVDVRFYDDVDLAITFDRRGNSDIVVGTWGTPFCSTATGNFLFDVAKKAGFDYSPTEGGVSDAMTFSSNGINSINLSVGYENEHTVNEFLVYKDFVIAYEFGLEIMKNVNRGVKMFGEVPAYSNAWIEAYVPSKYSYKSGKSKTYNDDLYDYDYGYDTADTWNYGSDYENKNNYYQADPFVYTIDKEIVISDGIYEIYTDVDNVNSLISQLENARDVLEKSLKYVK